MGESRIRFLLYPPTTIPTSVLCAINPSPKVNLFDLTGRLWADAAIQLALSRNTKMIDRALAEDLAEAFEVSVKDLPDDITKIGRFVRGHIAQILLEDGLSAAIERLHLITHSLNSLVVNMVRSCLDRG